MVVVEVVERVEELLRRLVLPREELHVVDEEGGALPVLAPEVLHGALREGGHEVVRVALGGDDRDAPAGGFVEDRVGDRVEQVRLAEAGVAVEEERVQTWPGFAATACAAANAKWFDAPTTKVSKR